MANKKPPSEEVLKKLTAKFQKAAKDTGKEAVRELKQTLSEPYPPASKPGEPPHKRTGELQQSVGYEVTTEDKVVKLTLKVTADHAFYLEYGTATLAPRPFFRRAFDKATKAFRKKVRTK